MPTLHGFPPLTDAPALTAHLRHHLAAQYRADIKRDRAELAALPRQRLRRDNQRFWHLKDRIAATVADLRGLEGV